MLIEVYIEIESATHCPQKIKEEYLSLSSQPRPPTTLSID